MTVIRIFALGVLCTYVAALPAQISSSTTTGDIELSIQTQDVSSGLPVAFSFQLVNTSGHDILLPSPSIRCEDPTMDGTSICTLTLRLVILTLPDRGAFAQMTT